MVDGSPDRGARIERRCAAAAVGSRRRRARLAGPRGSAAVRSRRCLGRLAGSRGGLPRATPEPVVSAHRPGSCPQRRSRIADCRERRRPGRSQSGSRKRAAAPRGRAGLHAPSARARCVVADARVHRARACPHRATSSSDNLAPRRRDAANPGGCAVAGGLHRKDRRGSTRRGRPRGAESAVMASGRTPDDTAGVGSRGCGRTTRAGPRRCQSAASAPGARATRDTPVAGPLGRASAAVSHDRDGRPGEGSRRAGFLGASD